MGKGKGVKPVEEVRFRTEEELVNDPYFQEEIRPWLEPILFRHYGFGMAAPKQNHSTRRKSPRQRSTEKTLPPT